MSINVIENLGVLTSEERKYFKNCEKILKGLLLNLKNKNKLKKLSEMPLNSYKVIDTSQRFNQAYNMIVPIFTKLEKMEEFIEHNKKYGINEKDLPYLFASQVIGTMITSSESFRNNLLTIIKMEGEFFDTMGLGALLRELEKVSPIYGKKLNKGIDSNLRNALVHGTFWIDGNHIVYCDDMNLINPKIKPLDKFLIEMKQTNIVSACLFSIMVLYAKKGFFD